MSNVPYNIISTGSKGNATIVNEYLLIDCGVPFRALQQHYKALKLVLLTHIHSDHFKKSTIQILARERPTLRFACCGYLAKELYECGVSKSNIDIVEIGKTYDYGMCKISPVPCVHDVPNCGYKVIFSFGKIIYITDTNSLNGISAPDYDLYLIEANYDDDEIHEKIKEKKASGEYAYEMRVLKSHLSKKKCDDFIYKNIGPTGEYVYMHCHRD